MFFLQNSATKITERCLASHTIALYMSRLHTVVNKAIAADITTVDPFTGYELPRPERKRRYLTREELKRLMITSLSASHLYLVHNLFLFFYHTGISLGNMCRLTVGNLEPARRNGLDQSGTWVNRHRVQGSAARSAAMYY